MDDKEIVELLYNRDERGVKAAQDKFSKLVMTVCCGILRSNEEAKQCANAMPGIDTVKQILADLGVL